MPLDVLRRTRATMIGIKSKNVIIVYNILFIY